MQIQSHKVTGVPYKEAVNIGGEITPTIVILHDTAGRLDKGNSAAYLASANSGKVSVHFVVERDGSTSQHVPTNRKANHAGASSFNGRSGCNSFAIGIEIVNPGKMTWASQGHAKAWWGQIFPISDYELREVTTAEHGAGVWMGYTEAQISAVTDLLRCLFGGIPTLTDITTHWYVSPGRKVDVNPLFPLDAVRAAVLGNDDPAANEAEAASDPAPVKELMVQVTTSGGSLNLRSWPSFNPNIIAAIPNGTVVPVLRQGSFDGRQWQQVLYDGKQGWIVASYATPQS